MLPYSQQIIVVVLCSFILRRVSKRRKLSSGEAVATDSKSYEKSYDDEVTYKVSESVETSTEHSNEPEVAVVDRQSQKSEHETTTEMCESEKSKEQSPKAQLKVKLNFVKKSSDNRMPFAKLVQT